MNEEYITTCVRHKDAVWCWDDAAQCMTKLVGDRLYYVKIENTPIEIIKVLLHKLHCINVILGTSTKCGCEESNDK